MRFVQTKKQKLKLRKQTTTVADLPDVPEFQPLATSTQLPASTAAKAAVDKPEEPRMTRIPTIVLETVCADIDDVLERTKEVRAASTGTSVSSASASVVAVRPRSSDVASTTSTVPSVSARIATGRASDADVPSAFSRVPTANPTVVPEHDEKNVDTRGTATVASTSAGTVVQEGGKRKLGQRPLQEKGNDIGALLLLRTCWKLNMHVTWVIRKTLLRRQIGSHHGTDCGSGKEHEGDTTAPAGAVPQCNLRQR